MESSWIDTDKKVEIINGIIASGVKRIEATSFVSPHAIPQLQDAREVIRSLNRKDVQLVVLIPNIRGAELALEVDVDEVNVVVSVSETHNQQNVRQTVHESISQISTIYEKIGRASCRE